MAMNTGGPGGLQSEINVTPLVDVVLVFADHLHRDLTADERL